MRKDILLCAITLQLLHLYFTNIDARDRHILVFGGNGFLGANTVEKLYRGGDNVTIVNRGNWYWDSYDLIRPYVQTITCDRTEELEKCEEFQNYITSDDLKIDDVIDFSAYSDFEIKETIKHLKDKISNLYIFISTDSIYDVCQKDHDGPSKETDMKRPQSATEREQLNTHHAYGHNKLLAEEALFNQRLQDGGFPFVILRIPDVIGPKDTTYRWWVYQLWLKMSEHFEEKPVTMPHFMEGYAMSLVYNDDVSRVILELLESGPQVRDQAINIAYPETFTLESFLKGIQSELGIETELKYTDSSDTSHLYYYPSVRRGPIDVSKAQDLLNWQPTPWDEVLKTNAHFYENAMGDEKFENQRDEIVQIVGHVIFPKEKSLERYYSAIEKAYDISLHHFRPKDEL